MTDRCATCALWNELGGEAGQCRDPESLIPYRRPNEGCARHKAKHVDKELRQGQ